MGVGVYVECGAYNTLVQGNLVSANAIGVIVGDHSSDFNVVIGNRIGVFDIANAMRLMVEKDMTVEEVDTIVGKELGRPGTALFGTVDLVGLDTAIHVMTHLYEAALDDEMRDLYRPAGFLEAMLAQKLLGNKTGQGFYRRAKNEKGEDVAVKVKLIKE